MVPRIGMSPRTKSRRRDGGEEYYSVVQDSPTASPIEKERRPNSAEAAYYMHVLNDGERRSPKSSEVNNRDPENAYYIQVMEGQEESTDYVVGSISSPINKEKRSSSPIYGNTPETPKTPKREDSSNDYYSKVYTMKNQGAQANASASNNNMQCDEDNSEEIDPVYSVSSDVTSRQDSPSSESGIKPINSNKQSVIYMNLRK